MAVAAFHDYAIRLDRSDNVAVLKRTAKSGTELQDGSATLRLAKTVPAGHKIAIATLSDGDPVIKYGQIIGFAKGDIAPGDHVHTHNVVMKDFGRDYQFCVDA